MILWMASKEQGIWWLGLGRFKIQVKAPWAWKSFTERYGYARFFPKNGWRVRFVWVNE